MNFEQKREALSKAKCQMNCSKELCLHDARQLYASGQEQYALKRLELGAQYAWGFSRPDGWVKEIKSE